ncbi:hypothetical protein HPB50_009763 [Hyalomma asiaticum]|uniref:Uncharacterized protein n=1 Tax=Hyalomma asiaticum TaxID=266040 RepID=A0ACB7S2D8_HYAAI|nr:hypothetical protein HPB50_009763 [Hyalomma asiaticum]
MSCRGVRDLSVDVVSTPFFARVMRRRRRRRTDRLLMLAQGERVFRVGRSIKNPCPTLCIPEALRHGFRGGLPSVRAAGCFRFLVGRLLSCVAPRLLSVRKRTRAMLVAG